MKDGHEEECATGWQRRVCENKERRGGEKRSKVKRSKDNRIEVKKVQKKREEIREEPGGIAATGRRE